MGVNAIEFCWTAGFWGIFFNDDDGLLYNECFILFGGLDIAFPVYFNFAASS